MANIRAEITVNGIVQGVGFRPYIHKKTKELELSGTVKNTSDGAEICLEGEESAIDFFIKELIKSPPTLAVIESVKTEKTKKTVGLSGFKIIDSEKGAENNTFVSPDVATCDDCLRELFSKDDRRAGYPFINCTNCGPRFTITRDVPYDRKNTTMSGFEMCDECRREYSDIEDRRYHAQPDCCEKCGPRLFFLDGRGKEVRGDAISLAAEQIKSKKIVAVKGIGGVHLACLAEEDCAKELRRRKRRDEKPFAVMCRDISAAKKICRINESEEKLLKSHRRPIVLLEKKDKNALLHISENSRIGVMLPYTPVHHLLFAEGFELLIMTSANISDTPIIYKNEEAVRELSGIADGFLLNDREIFTRCDDSLVWEVEGSEYFARRSRGYVPYPVLLKSCGEELFAAGAEQKASFALSKKNRVFISQHIGDLKNAETLMCYESGVKSFEKLFDISPRGFACDMHPDYLSTEYAERRAKELGAPIYKIQHHHAHMASCMADNGLDGECIGIVWDGTGLGTDGSVWGGEFLVGGYGGFERAGSLKKIKIPGGDLAAKEIYRSGIALMKDASLSPRLIFGETEKIEAALDAGINCFETSSMGRLFDGVAAILGIKLKASYEGQGAVLLEAAAAESARVYGYDIKNGEMDFRPMIRALANDVLSGADMGECAAAFMNTLISAAADMCGEISEKTGIKRAVLSGGSFQNMYLLKGLTKELTRRGTEVFRHKRVSPNDEGISLGQMAIIRRRM